MAHLIQIGNSQGIRIPKAIILQAGLDNAELELKVVADGVLISPQHKVRQGWKEACQKMHARKEDQLFIDDSISSNPFDEEEWEW